MKTFDWNVYEQALQEDHKEEIWHMAQKFKAYLDSLPRAQQSETILRVATLFLKAENRKLEKQLIKSRVQLQAAK
jgi:hypothetical protein